MSCKRAAQAHVLNDVSLVIPILAILIALVVPGKITAGGRRSAEPPVVPTSQDASPYLFLPAVAYDSGGYNAASVAVGDVNKDGKPDVIVANACGSSSDCKDSMFGFEGTVALLLGNGDGTFQPAVAYASGGQTPVSVAVADMNGDGKSDIVVVNECASGTRCVSGNGSVGILLGNGDGTFQAATTYNSGGFLAVSLAVSDFNGDGKLDVAVAHSYGANHTCCMSPALGVLMGNGDGTFQPAVMYGGGGQTSVVVGDVNGDHRPDLVVSRPPSSPANSGVEILVGNGDGSFQPPVVYDSGSPFPYSLAITDLNGDGKLDLAVDHGVTNAGLDSFVSILLGNGDGTFQAAVTYDSGVHAAISVAVSDVGGAGRVDLLLAGNSGLGVLLGNGDGTFQPALTYGSGGSLATSVVAADVNGDGKLDLVAGNVYGRNSLDGAVGVLLSLSKSATTAYLSSSPNPSIYGQKITWTAKVTTSGTVAPTGNVVFNGKDLYGHTFVLGRATLDSSGVATLIKSNLNANAYQVTSVYLGDVMNKSSRSSVLNQVVRQTTSRAVLNSSRNPATQGQLVTFTATITSPTVTPTGPVTFTVGKQVLGTAQIVPWTHKATLAISTLPVGSTMVTVTYLGDSNITRSAASLTQTVQ